MPNCSGACAAATPSAGKGFIFRGGDTWHFGNSAASPYTGGAFDGFSNNGWKGTSGSPIYIGVDANWYTGTSWARPIFTGDNPISPGINSYVASCPYQTAGDGGTMVDFSGGDGYIIFDNFELTGMCQTTTNDQAYVGMNQPIGGLQFLNLYMHGWSHLAFHDSSDPVSCGSPGICFAMWGFRGSAGGTPLPVFKNIVIDGSD
ncbi:MAG TPA: hypothetical protein VJT08_06010, partial [Terriglobales bacterium]|nr:hypothetical protein [Terriglobales bacterium]